LIPSLRFVGVSITARVLLADSDRRRSDLLQKHLTAWGCLLHLEADGFQAQQHLFSAPPDLAVLDAALPTLSGIEITKRLRDQGSTLPLLVLCRTDHYSERVAALDAGADDALAFPFALEEFTARIRALLRRAHMGASDVDGAELIHRDLTVNTDERLVTRAGLSLKLTVKEYELLLYLLRYREQVLSRHQILTAVWGDSWVGDDNLLDVYIRYLRKKIERPELEPLVHTVRGVGFMLK
jgi:DNA-binding response OmpR family regulator